MLRFRHYQTATGFPVVRDEKQMKKFVKRARKLGVEVMISFNGKHAVFSKMASDPVLRKRFTDEIWRIVKKYRLSGVDNDWEFPRTTDGTMESNLQLMKDLAELCRGGKKQYYLTMAVTSGMYPGARDAAITDEVFALVDWFERHGVRQLFGDKTGPAPLHIPHARNEL